MGELSPSFKHAAARAMWRVLRDELRAREESSRVPSKPFSPMAQGYHSGILEVLNMMERMDAAAERELVAIGRKHLAEREKGGR